jgi:hypothetical protein
MQHPDYPHLFTPIRIGNFEVPNRICHVPTDISSANADGSVNQRVINDHEQIARGGCGFIIVGASTPDRSTGRRTARPFRGCRPKSTRSCTTRLLMSRSRTYAAWCKTEEIGILANSATLNDFRKRTS